VVGDETLEALWKNALDRWEDDKAHSAFLSYCQESDQLAEAAARYKGMTADRDRGESAQKRLQGIAMLAIARLEATRTRSPQTKRQAGGLLLVLFFVAATVALIFYLTGT
jgi:hypothetical protein